MVKSGFRHGALALYWNAEFSVFQNDFDISSEIFFIFSVNSVVINIGTKVYTEGRFCEEENKTGNRN